MSVDFTTMIGYGYMLTWEEVDDLTAEHEDLWDYIYGADCYCDHKDCDYFFGIVLKEVPCGGYVSITDLATGTGVIDTVNKLMALLAEFDICWNNNRWSQPDVCVINRVH